MAPCQYIDAKKNNSPVFLYFAFFPQNMTLLGRLDGSLG